MKQITKKKEIKQVEDAIRLWKSIAGNKLPDCFEKFFENKNGITDQRQRLSAIRFGKVTSSFKKLLCDESNQLWFRMALFPETKEITRTLQIIEGKKAPKTVKVKETVIEKEVFSVVLEVVHKTGESSYFTSSSISSLLDTSNSVLSPGLQYGSNRSSEIDFSNSVELVGLRPVVSNEMCMNWCLVDPYKIPGLFNVIQPDLTGVSEVQRVFYELITSLEKDKSKKVERLFEKSLAMTTELASNPFNNAVVRAHGYKVNGYDLSALRANIANSDKKEVDGYFTIHLGMKDPGVNFNEGQFSLVTEFMEASKAVQPVKNAQSFDDLTDKDKVDLILEVSDETIFAPGIGLDTSSVQFWVNNKSTQGMVMGKVKKNEKGNKVALDIDGDSGWEFDFQSYSSSFDDFLHPCPPLCGSGTGGNP